MENGDLFAPGIERDRLHEIEGQIPSLPSRISYFDDFDEMRRSIDRLNESNVYEIRYNGTTLAADFSRFHPAIAKLLKHVFVRLISRGVTSHTAYGRVTDIVHFTPDELADLATFGPHQTAKLWSRLLSKAYPRAAYEAAKALLRTLCDLRIADWSPAYLEFVGKSLPGAPFEKYAALKTGDAFLSIEQEALIVGLIDEASLSVNVERERWPYRDLADIAMLVCAFQFGLRPVQIARLKIKDVKHRAHVESGANSVHLSFPMVKQRAGVRALPMVRRVKPEWNAIFIELLTRAHELGLEADRRIFAVDSGREAGLRIATRARHLLSNDSVSTYTFRHSAAQRMVNAGANHEELAAFLGHSDITTALVYFKTSASQAERINEALGISNTYVNVARIAKQRYITAEDLAQLKADHQIGGVPHGIPISGIGGCTSGQRACQYNPAISCYTCRRFMPLHDASIHRQVLRDLREVVSQFQRASHDEQASPAYLQLKRTIDGVQGVIAGIEGDWHE
ncbi:site-specific integrase [Dyella japonica]|uniref:site-specific integrase n=1 Tax=Dyella japonica TaxID=231455 RepID=UPI0003145222|nr:site-specific integrase [Dyella japonica]